MKIIRDIILTRRYLTDKLIDKTITKKEAQELQDVLEIEKEVASEDADWQR
jgi:hypothetical protein